MNTSYIQRLNKLSAPEAQGKYLRPFNIVSQSLLLSFYDISLQSQEEVKFYLVVQRGRAALEGKGAANDLCPSPYLAGCDGDAVAAFTRCSLNSEFITVLTFVALEHRGCTDLSRFLSGLAGCSVGSQLILG